MVRRPSGTNLAPIRYHDLTVPIDILAGILVEAPTALVLKLEEGLVQCLLELSHTVSQKRSGRDTSFLQALSPLLDIPAQSEKYGELRTTLRVRLRSVSIKCMWLIGPGMFAGSSSQLQRP